MSRAWPLLIPFNTTENWQRIEDWITRKSTTTLPTYRTSAVLSNPMMEDSEPVDGLSVIHRFPIYECWCFPFNFQHDSIHVLYCGSHYSIIGTTHINHDDPKLRLPIQYCTSSQFRVEVTCSLVQMEVNGLYLLKCLPQKAQLKTSWQSWQDHCTVNCSQWCIHIEGWWPKQKWKLCSFWCSLKQCSFAMYPTVLFTVTAPPPHSQCNTASDTHFSICE